MREGERGDSQVYIQRAAATLDVPKRDEKQTLLWQNTVNVVRVPRKVRIILDNPFWQGSVSSLEEAPEVARRWSWEGRMRYTTRT